MQRIWTSIFYSVVYVHLELLSDEGLVLLAFLHC